MEIFLVAFIVGVDRSKMRLYDIEENKQTLTDDTPVFDKAPNGQKFTESVKEWKI